MGLLIATLGVGGWARRAAPLAALLLAALTLAATAVPATAAVFIDGAVTDIKPEQRIAVAKPGPVQVLFVFQTKEAPNRQATKFTQKAVMDAVKASGLFSDVSETAVANGAILSIVIDDVPMADAASKGFMTGLTFGLKGTLARDDYICTVEFVGSASAAKITKTGHHSIYMQVGNVPPPPEGVQVANATEAVMTMVRQIVSHPLNDLAGDQAFNPDAPPTPPAPPTSDAAAPQKSPS